jgi:FlaA1/EpsC-like NDP-sugar epimerase
MMKLIDLRLLPQRALALQRMSKRRIAMLGDAILGLLTVYLALYLRLGEAPEFTRAHLTFAAAALFLSLPCLWAYGVYKEIFSQAGIRSLGNIGRACALYAVPLITIFTLIGVPEVPRTLGLMHPILLFLSISASRVFARAWLAGMPSAVSQADSLPRVVVYGAGGAGRRLATALAYSRDMRLIGFLDDDAKLHGATINGLPIFDPASLTDLKKRHNLTDVLLAMPSATQRRRNDIITRVREAALRVRTLPTFMEFANGRVQMSDIQELDVQDLLGRDAVEPDRDLLTRRIAGRVVLVTGAGGSIGSEICRQALAEGPAKLLLLELSEYALYSIHEELARKSSLAPEPTPEIIPLLGSVADERRMRSILEAWRPDTIYHAAAYKHVPLVEHNPREGIANNLLGTWTFAKVAAELKVPDFVLISTDKAVRPTNVMGATKRAAELVLQALSSESETRFSMVRFGNVLGSSGSVVPLFRRQIQNSGPVTVTDLRMTRYFMTIPEAAQLVIQASAMATGGEVFVLDMGNPIQIADLARNMIELSGLRVRDATNPTGDIEILEIGLRPGEKLYEELLIGNDPAPTLHPRILKANETFMPMSILSEHLTRLSAVNRDGDGAAVLSALQAIVPEFISEAGVADFVERSAGTLGLRTHLRSHRG